MNWGNSVNQKWCKFGFLQNPFKKAKFIERFYKQWQNNPSGNSNILLNKTGTRKRGGIYHSIKLSFNAETADFFLNGV